MLFVTSRVPPLTSLRYNAATSTGVSGCNPATSLSDWATRSTRRPGMTRFGLLPSMTSRPSINPYFAKNGAMTLCIVEGASVDSMMTSGRVPGGRLRSASATPSSASISGPYSGASPDLSVCTQTSTTSASLHAYVSCVADKRPAPTASATILSRPGSTPPIGERPSLIASIFQPEVGELRCTTTTRGGGDPSVAGDTERSAAMGIPTIPGPTTAIFLVFMTLPSGFLACPRRAVGWSCDHRARRTDDLHRPETGCRLVDEALEPELEIKHSPDLPTERRLDVEMRLDGVRVEDSALPCTVRLQDVEDELA